MSAAHTPGPWTVNMTGCLTSHGMPIITKYNGHLLAQLAIKNEANARLIAAAPDLLDIAQRLALATNDGDDQAQGTHYIDKQGVIRCKGSFLALIEDARAAIAKATGAAS